ncbi:MAG: Asd/ArgC dimerization domain-containing protein [Anaerolineae bacterium]
MLGYFNGSVVVEHDAIISPSCNRVAVIDGHMVNVAVELAERPSFDEVIDTWNAFRGPAPVPSLPSAPEQPLVYLTKQDRPQPRRDRNVGNGRQTTTIGRLRRPNSGLQVRGALAQHHSRGGGMQRPERRAAGDAGLPGRFPPGGSRH